MEVTSGAEDGFVREWAPCSHILSLIPPRIQNGLFSSELSLTCVDAVSEYIALGTNVGLVYWFDRKKGKIQRLRCENTTSPITFVKIASTVDYMVGAGNAAGQVAVFQVPRDHHDSVPADLKPKVEPKVERYTIGDLHKSKITSIEWSKNGMRLFSGDKDGVIIMTEIDFYMHLCKSMEIVNEEHEIIQLSYWGSSLLVSSAYRTIVCTRDGVKWTVNQLGTKERKSLCALGAVFQYSYAQGGAVTAYCARPGVRIWRADGNGTVLQTLLFKEAISNPLTIAELLNPSQKKHVLPESEHNLGPLHVFRDHFLVSHNDKVLYILDPRTATAVAVVDDLRRILSVSVNKEEIFILEGGRSLVRLGNAPDPVASIPDNPLDLMTKSLTTSIQQAVNTVREITLDTTVQITSSVLEHLEQPFQPLFKDFEVEKAAKAEDLNFELPPVKGLPENLSENVLASIINEFRDVSNEVEERRLDCEEMEGIKMYRSIMKRKDEELIHSRSIRGVGSESSGGSTPRALTPVRRRPDVSYTMPTVMAVSGYGNMPQETDELLEKQIEEKEKILAKMLNLESLSIKSPVNSNDNKEKIDSFPYHDSENTDISQKTNVQDFVNSENAIAQKKNVQDVAYSENAVTDLKSNKKTDDVTSEKQQRTKQKICEVNADLVPKLMKLPNNWNLDNMELRLDIQSDVYIQPNLDRTSPDIDGWEVI